MKHPNSCTTLSLAGGRMRRLLAALCLGLAVLTAGAGSATRADEATVRVMTRNMYQGSDFAAIFAATTPAEFVAAVTTVYNEIVDSNPAERAAAMAKEIARERPDLVGLQEATILRDGGAIATNVVSDLTQLLLDALDDMGRPYEVVAIMPGIDVQAPSTLGFNVRHTYRTVLLARAGYGSNLELSNMQVQHFIANRVIPTAVGVSFVNTRGWASVDVRVRGRKFRFVTTHLENTPPFSTQQAQASELLATAANTTMPVIMVADFNTDANNSADPSFPTYQLLTVTGGFTDAWKEKFPSLPGNTCCQDDDLLNPTSLLSTRVDLILYRGDMSVRDIKLVGHLPSDKTPSGLWPSDHAGVVAGLRLSNGHCRSTRHGGGCDDD
jgi:endonuclease/exonuclease/phosphatase family metal-dependent hydrolase